MNITNEGNFFHLIKLYFMMSIHVTIFKRVKMELKFLGWPQKYFLLSIFVKGHLLNKLITLNSILVASIQALLSLSQVLTTLTILSPLRS